MAEFSGRQRIEQDIKDLEKEIHGTKYNKATQFHVGLIKAKIATLKEKMTKKGKGQKDAEGYNVKKSGDATVVLVGFPSVGKSTLLNSITKQESKVAAYAFTTLTVVPGILNYKSAKIQILDVPGIVHGAATGTGRGRQVISVMRTADLLLIVIDATHPEHYGALLNEITDAGIRINTRPPNLKITKTSKGGVRIGNTVRLTKIDKPTITAICKEFKINSADIILREDIDADSFIDALEGSKVYPKSMVILNKIDLVNEEELKQLKKELKPELCISANNKQGTEDLKDLIFNKLELIRIYLKEIGKKPDMEIPLIMKNGATLRDLCLKLHKDFLDKFKYVKIWGKSVKFDGQQVQKLDHELKDEDIVEIHIS